MTLAQSASGQSDGAGEQLNDSKMDASVSLDAFGLAENTDKSSFVQDYLRHFDELFSPLRRSKITIIEIGVLAGASMRTWASFFTEATIVGIDANLDCKRHESGRIRIEIGSQEDPGFLADVVRRYQPTIIIDDGSHLAHHVLFTFERLFPSLLPGGFYVIEDLSIHFGERAPTYRGPAQVTPPEYLLQLARHLMGEPADPAEHHGMTRYVRENTDYLRFIRHAAIFRKRAVDQEIESAIVTSMKLATKTGSADWLERAAAVVVRKGASPSLAEQLLRQAIATDPKRTLYHARLSNALLLQNRIPEAVESLRRAVELDPNYANGWSMLGGLLERLGEFTAAESAYANACAKAPGNPVFRRHLDGLRDRLNSAASEAT